MRSFTRVAGYFAISLVAVTIFGNSLANAAEPNDTGFSIEVSPAPLVETVKPGEKKTVELRIRNSNTITEQLKLELQSFEVNKDNGEIKLLSGKPPEVSDWIRFAQPIFSVKPGESSIQQVQINTPASAGFTYTFAIVISRQNKQASTSDKTAIEGSVAVFSLLNVDKPGASRKLEISELTTTKRVYEYLPATLTLKLKNAGNTLLRPGGNVYIQRNSGSGNPTSVLAVNPTGNYLLPGVTREYPVQWNDGFPVYVKTQEAANSQPKQHLQWNWGKSQIRIGRYVAQVVVVYNDGQRDVPVQTEISFWVLPWKILTAFVFGLIILVVGMIAIIKFTLRMSKRNKRFR